MLKIQKRDTGIELARIIGCLIVIGVHVSLNDIIVGEYDLSRGYINCLLADGVAIFWIITGCFLFRTDSYQKVLSRTIKTIAVPIALFAIFNIFFSEWIMNGGKLISSIFQTPKEYWVALWSAISLNTSIPQTGHLWYCYTYILVMVMFPILHAFALWMNEDVRREKAFCMISFILMLINDLTLNKMLIFSHHGLTAAIPATIEILWGHIIYRHKEKVIPNNLIRILALIIGFILLNFIRMYIVLLTGSKAILYWYSTVGLICATGIIVFCLFIGEVLKERLFCEKWINKVAGYTFMIYLIHIPLRNLLYRYDVDTKCTQLLSINFDGFILEILYTILLIEIIFMGSLAISVILCGTKKIFINVKKNFGSGLYTGVCFFLSFYFLRLRSFSMKYLLIISCIFIFCFIYKQKAKIQLDMGICSLVVTMCSLYIIQYGVKGAVNTSAYITMSPYVCPIMYMMASYLAGDIKNDIDWEKKMIGILMSLVIGFTIHGLMNSYMYYAGYVLEGTRKWYDIWTRSYMPGTQHSLFWMPALAVFLPAIIWFHRHKIANSCIILASVFFIWISLVTRSRMSILIFGMVFGCEILLYFILEKPIMIKKNWIVICGGIVGVIIGCYLLKDVGVIRAFIENLSKDGGILNNVRFKMQEKALKQLFKYPIGGRKMDLTVDHQHSYCHNVWLDMANASGLIPFFSFTFFTIYSFINLSRFLKIQNISAKMKLIIVGLYMSFFLFYSVEPALDCSIHYMTPWMLINGLIQGTLGVDKLRLEKGNSRVNT